ncbi:hypothetical protein EDC04DRAFT_950462 [Pisolithus marmoratus]|nr:hypothetical protein EDC04DRAFT_950462 [Pisolithus marmoratus]
MLQAADADSDGQRCEWTLAVVLLGLGLYSFSATSTPSPKNQLNAKLTRRKSQQDSVHSLWASFGIVATVAADSPSLIARPPNS